MAGQGRQEPLPLEPDAYGDARLSPDGTLIAYTSDKTDDLEVYIRPFPGPGVEEQVSID